MKRRHLERHLRAQGCRLIAEGAKHAKWADVSGELQSAVPRHTEIGTHLARAICKQLGIPIPRGR